MQSKIKRLIAAVLLGGALTFGGFVGGSLAQSTPAIACGSPTGCGGGGGGG